MESCTISVVKKDYGRDNFMSYLKHLALLTVFLSSYTIAQTRTERLAIAAEGISSALLSYGNHTVKLDSGVAIVDVDSSIGDEAVADGRISDPYGTLKGCFLFAAYDTADTGGGEAVGIFKNRSILWLSDPFNVFYSQVFGGRFWATLDLNNDSTVEILASWTTGGRGEDEALWIFSWNGTQGRRINSLTTSGFTAINANGFSVIDIDGNGVAELTGEIGSPDPEGGFIVEGLVVFCWNDSLYVQSANCPQIGNRVYTVANNLQIEIKAKVGKQSTGELYYGYTLFNNPSSNQRIASFYVKEFVDSFKNSAPAGWTSGRLQDERLICYDEYPDTARIYRGHSLDGFTIEAFSVPVIQPFYIQAYHEIINHSVEHQDQADIDDIFSNSVKGFTVGPKDTPSTLDGISFLDTLKGYISQSRSLGWISNQPTADKYSAFVDSTKAELLRSDSAAALVTLDSVMQQSVRDSSSSLTSEAFALIYFNAQYLAGQLPAQQQNSFTITSSEGQNGSIVPLGNNTVNAGDSITFAIAPAIGYHISGVFIDNADTSVGAVSRYTFRNAIADHMISAFFDIDQYSLTVDTVPSFGGRVAKIPDRTQYDSNSVVQLTAVPNTCYHFVNWSGDVPQGGSSTNPLNVTMSADRNITANFAINTYMITATGGPNGSITPDSNVVVNCGDSITFTMTPATGYHVSGVYVDSVTSVGAVTSYTFRNVTAIHTIDAFFAINQHDITASADTAHGSIAPQGDNTVNYGDSIRFTIIPHTGYHVSGVYIDNADTSVGAVPSYTFRNVTADHMISAFFDIDQYSLTVDTVPPNGGGVTKNPNHDQYDSNAVVQVTATPNTGFRFDHWSGDLTGSTNPVNVTMNSAKTVTANFVAVVQITVQTNPVALGDSVDGVYHNSTQSFTWDSGTVHSLGTTTSKSSSGKQFAWTNWSDGGAISHVITVTRDSSFTANFRTQFQLTVSSSPDTNAGTTWPRGSNNWSDSSSVDTITATAKTGYRFDHWSGDANGSTNPITVTMNASKNVTANFTRQFLLTVSVNPDTTQGTTNPMGSHWYDTSTVVSDTAKPKPCYHFVNWTGDASGSANPLNVTMNATKNITANFAINQDTIAASAGSGGSISPSGNVILNCGSNQSFTITANSCYHIDSVLVDGSNQGGISSYTFTNVTAHHSIRAAFRINQDTIAASAGSGGSISPTGTVFVNCGSNQTFTISAYTCYHIDSVIVDGANQGAVSSYTFTNVTINHSIRTAFKINQDTIAASAGGGGSITPPGNVVVNCGSNQTFTVTANTCYHIDSVIVDGTNQGGVSSYTFTNVTAHHSIRAAFRINQDTIAASAGAGGSISPSGAVPVNCGSNQSFTVTPNGCYRIDSVIVDGVKKDSTTSYTFTNVTANHTMRAVFAVNNETISASVDGDNPWGSISPSGTVVDTCGANQMFTITPNACFGVSQVLVDGVNMGSITTYTFTNINSNHTIWASFSRLSYWINAGAGSGGSISPSGKFGVYCGTNQTFTITPNTGFNISNVVVDGVSKGAISTYTFQNVTSNHSISATFTCIGYTITASAGGGGSINPSGNVNVCSGASQTFTITASSGYTISNVVVDGVSKGAISTYTFQNVTSNHTISASFNCQPPCCIINDAAYDHLTLTDAKGAQKVLLVRNALRPIASGLTDNSIASQLSLGTLSASFQSGQTVQSVSPHQGSTVFSIVVSGATFPLTLKLTTNAENNIQYWLVRSGQSNLQLTNSSSVQIGSSTNGIINIQPLAKQPCQ